MSLTETETFRHSGKEITQTVHAMGLKIRKHWKSLALLATTAAIPAALAINHYIGPDSQGRETTPISKISKETILPIKEYDNFKGVLYVDDKHGNWGEAITMALVPTQDGRDQLFWFATIPGPTGVMYPAYMADLVGAEGNVFTATTKDGWNIQATKDSHGLTGILFSGKPGQKPVLTRQFSVSPNGTGKEAAKRSIQEVLRVGFRNLSGTDLSTINTKPIEDAVGYQNWPVNP